MTKERKSYKQIHMSVPESDKDVLNWLKSQNNVSMTLRELVRDVYFEYGEGDWFEKRMSAPTYVQSEEEKPKKKRKKKVEKVQETVSEKVAIPTEIEQIQEKPSISENGVDKTSVGIKMTANILDDPFMGANDVKEEKEEKKETKKQTSVSKNKLNDLKSMMDA